MHPYVKTLLRCIALEEQEQLRRYSLDQHHNLRALKAEGLALHPIRVTRKYFGYADYPEISFHLPYPAETTQFKDGAAIECFFAGEEMVKGVLNNLDGRNGEFRLFAPDFPDWIEENGVGIKLAPDTRTTGIMKKTLTELEGDRRLIKLFSQLHDQPVIQPGSIPVKPETISFENKQLNKSQQQAVLAILQNESVLVVHGPPGTGKTTTLVEAILQLTQDGKKVIVSAPSNTAVDHITKVLIKKKVKVLRVGNTGKADPEVFTHTPEGRLANSREQKELKQLRIRAEEFRRMALKYKRQFGREEKEQRNLLFKEVRSIRTEIKKFQNYHEHKLFEEAMVIAGTPIGLYDASLHRLTVHTLVLDEAGQCVEPLAWCIFPLAERIVLAGDHCQLPPTVLSQEASAMGFNISILELAINRLTNICLLDTQYRMRASIAGFSNQYFYKGLLQTAMHLHNLGMHLTFIDTAGSGFEEKPGSDGTSLQNEGELKIMQKLLETEHLDHGQTSVISPYAGQVDAARELFPPSLRVSTIDSFQGQEAPCILLSMVRSNDTGDIGFLKDYRRMNVALTRAREQLFIIGDSATIGADPFYRSLLAYIEAQGAYRSVWEFDLNT
jgi:superfamily I DNA and/or RNA helicase